MYFFFRASEDFKTNPGAIELILQHPVTPDQVN